MRVREKYNMFNLLRIRINIQSIYLIIYKKQIIIFMYYNSHVPGVHDGSKLLKHFFVKPRYYRCACIHYKILYIFTMQWASGVAKVINRLMYPLDPFSGKIKRRFWISWMKLMGIFNSLKTCQSKTLVEFPLFMRILWTCQLVDGCCGNH